MNAQETCDEINARRKREREDHLRRSAENWEGLALEVLENALGVSASYFDDVQIAAAERLLAEMKAAAR